MTEIKNHFGMPAHPTDNYAFWGTERAELEKIRDNFDQVAEALQTYVPRAEAVQLVTDLMDWAIHQRSLEDAYNDGEA